MMSERVSGAEVTSPTTRSLAYDLQPRVRPAASPTTRSWKIHPTQVRRSHPVHHPMCINLVPELIVNFPARIGSRGLTTWRTGACEGGEHYTLEQFSGWCSGFCVDETVLFCSAPAARITICSIQPQYIAAVYI
jgi:hypothetical protein